MIWAVLCLGPQRAIFPATFSSSHRNSSSFLSSLSNPNPTNQPMTRYLSRSSRDREAAAIPALGHVRAYAPRHLLRRFTYSTYIQPAHRTTATRSALCSQIHRWRFSSCFGRLAALLALLLVLFCCELASKKSRVARGGATHPSNNPPKKGDEPGVAIQAA
ncbi:hypothetical protein CI102_14594 [Trichoderma harzianum]|nr:hypothetical protein CI102_14594 [Trichoderma harzianum]